MERVMSYRIHFFNVLLCVCCMFNPDARDCISAEQKDTIRYKSTIFIESDSRNLSTLSLSYDQPGWPISILY
jgi:hypothetical protein